MKSRSYRVGPDIVFGIFDRNLPCQTDHPGFSRHIIRGSAGETRIEAEYAYNGSDVDDGASAIAQEYRDRRARAEKDALEIDIDHAVPIRDGELMGAKRMGNNSSVVDEEVESSVTGHRLGHREIDRGDLGDVDLKGQGFTAIGLDQ